MKNKNITINDLAVMVQKGFDDITDKMATKVELHELKKEMHDGFEKVNGRLDKFEDQEIKPLKERIRKVENALAIE
jgi:hypothetical protein